MRKFESLSANEMESISGGQVSSCGDFWEVMAWLDENNPAQADIIFDLYYEQYCVRPGAV